MGALDRAVAAASLVRALRETRAGHVEIPDREALLEVQRSAERAGGIAYMVAEIMPCYTGEPLGRTRSGEASPDRPASTEPSSPSTAERLVVGAELNAVRTALHLATTAGVDAIRTATRTLEQLVSDVYGVRDRSHRETNGRITALAWTEAMGGDGDVTVSGDGSTAWIGSAGRDGSLVRSVLRLHHEHAVVHGRLVGSTDWHEDRMRVSHWHRARVIGPATLDFLRRFLDEVANPSPKVGGALLEAGSVVGIGPEQVSRAVPALRAALPNAIEAWRNVGVRTTCPHREDGPRVADPLAVVYSLADLVAAETLTSMA